MYASHLATDTKQADREANPDASSMLQQPSAELQPSWQQESSSHGGWQAAPPNLTGWPASGSAPDGLASSNGPGQQASTALGAVAAASHASAPAQAARMLSPPDNNNGIAPQPPPAAPQASPYSAVTDAKAAAPAAPSPSAQLAPATAPAGREELAAAVGGLNSSALPGEPTGRASTPPPPPPSAGKSPSASPGASVSPGGGTARAPAKKKPRGPRKKKPKVAAGAGADGGGPVRRRRVIKVKRARPAELPLGDGGREKAMDILRLLAGSPLSEEFRRPVVQMHPEVRFVYCSTVCCRYVSY